MIYLISLNINTFAHSGVMFLHSQSLENAHVDVRFSSTKFGLNFCFFFFHIYVGHHISSMSATMTAICPPHCRPPCLSLCQPLCPPPCQSSRPVISTLCKGSPTRTDLPTNLYGSMIDMLVLLRPNTPVNNNILTSCSSISSHRQTYLSNRPFPIMCPFKQEHFFYF